MTVTENQFPLGYFYIVSKMNELVLDIRDPENATVSIDVFLNRGCYYIWQLTYFVIGGFKNRHGS